jgi:hypothetical protein
MSHIVPARHDVASLFQSLAETVAQRIDDRDGTASETRGTAGGKRPNVNHPVVAAAGRIAGHWEQGEEAPATPPSGVKGTVYECAKLAAELLRARLTKDPKAAELEDELKFSTCDPEWLEAITDYEKYFGPEGEKNPIPYVRYQSMDDFVLPSLKPDARVALIGDWGTGTDDARRVLTQVAAHRPDVLIHLGDIYYAGTEDECQKYFLDLLDEVFDRQANPLPVYTLTGNHDMYSGGAGYYGLLPKLNPSPPYAPDQGQPASYFALRTTDGAWQLLAMDTGLHDHDPFTVSKDVTWLEPAEEAWHVDKVKRFTAGGGRTVLLSHHQLFSAFSGIGDYASRPAAERAVNPKLMATWAKLREAGDVAAWFWGHEHNLCIYRPYAGLAKGRCVGHGAIPTFLESDPYAVLDGLPDDRPQLVDQLDAPGTPVELAADDQVYAHGFVIVQLDDQDRSATASYYQETADEPLWVERL